MNRVVAVESAARARVASSAKSPHPAQRFVVPLFAYYAIALAVPIANGSGSTGAHFLEHAAFVVLGPLAMLATLVFVRSTWRRVISGGERLAAGK